MLEELTRNVERWYPGAPLDCKRTIYQTKLAVSNKGKIASKHGLTPFHKYNNEYYIMIKGRQINAAAYILCSRQGLYYPYINEVIYKNNNPLDLSLDNLQWNHND